jgi:hypothetical protein
MDVLSLAGAPLGHHIRIVFGGGSEEQMLGIDTPPVVAAMADEHPLRDRPGEVLVADTIRSKRFSINPEFAVSRGRKSRHPQPAACVGFRRELGLKSGEVFAVHTKYCSVRK